MNYKQPRGDPDSALPDALTLPELDDPWPLYRGPLLLGEKAVPMSAVIQATWQPRPRLAWHAEPPESGSGYSVDTGPALLTFPPATPGLIEGGFIKRLATLTHEVDGVCTRVVKGDIEARLARLTFVVINMPAPVDAAPVTSPDGVRCDRLELSLGPWSVTLDAASNIVERRQRLEMQGGFGATHAGELKLASGGTFTVAEAEEALATLQLALSFAVARWVSPVRLRGYRPLQVEAACEMWTGWKLEAWDGGRFSWWNGRRADDLADYVSLFAQVHLDTARGPVFERLIQYAVSASGAVSIAVEASMQIAQAAMELLAWVRIRPNVSSKEYRSLNFDEKLRRLLGMAAIDRSVPGSLTALNSYQSQRQSANRDLDPRFNPKMVGDAPEVLGQIRNGFTHPKIGSSNIEVYAVPGAVTDAWRLSLQYLQLLILHWIGYNGSYLSRLPDSRWADSVSPVPWSAGGP